MEFPQEPANIDGRLVTRRLDQLSPHPSYSRYGLAVSAFQLSRLILLGTRAWEEPIAITGNGWIIDGYARVECARVSGRTTIACIEYQRTEEEAARDLIQRHLGSNRLNNFCRILLARELEPWFKAKALANQKAGGVNKGSSKLMEADRVDVAAKIAEAADASVGNVSKVKQLLRTAVQELVQALRRGEVSIHRAWLLSKLPPTKQREELALSQCKRSIKKDMRALGSRYRSKSLTLVPDPGNLIRLLSVFEWSERGSVSVFVSKARGRGICVTEELLLEAAQQEVITSAESIVEADIN